VLSLQRERVRSQRERQLDQRERENSMIERERESQMIERERQIMCSLYRKRESDHRERDS